MLKIWGRTDSPNVQKVMWCVHELGLPYARIDAGHEFGLVKEPWYLAMNPNGLIPTIEDDGFVLWESNAIVRYLCARHSTGDLSPTDPHDFADADRWMSWQGSTLGPIMRRIVFEIIRTPAAEQDTRRVAALLADTAGIWSILDRHMTDRAFVIGSRLTMADFVFGPHLRLWLTYPIARPDLQNLEAWHRRISARDAFVRSLRPPPTAS